MSRANYSTKFLFIWDNDAVNSVNNLPEIGKCFKFCFSKNSSNQFERGIENVYEESFITDDLFTEPEKRIDGLTKITKQMLNKTKFFEKVKEQKDPKFFSGFEKLVQKIESILQHD